MLNEVVTRSPGIASGI